MEFTAVILGVIVCSSKSADAHIFFLPITSGLIPSQVAYKCSCDFIYDNYDPICASDGLTYLNPSQFYCDKKCKSPDLSIAHKGSCGPEEPRGRSSANRNSTQLERTLKILNKCSCSLHRGYDPVCGSNGITYDNLSELLCDKKCKQPNLSLSRYGLCREEEYFKDVLPFLTDAVSKCDCEYGDDYDPICATDGYTYPNLLAISCVAECNNPSLQVVHYGSCIENQASHNFGALRCNCVSSSEIYRPICATNGITYDNLSLFACAKKCSNPNLRIVHENPCRDYFELDERKLTKM